VWPGNVLKPPEGVPERRFLTITFLEVNQRPVKVDFTVDFYLVFNSIFAL
jgi:hypothetical protein